MAYAALSVLIFRPFSCLTLSMSLSALVSAFVRPPRMWCPRTPLLRTARQGASRIFGSKAAIGNPPGEISIYDEQDVLKLDEDRLRRTLTQIRRVIGYDTYDVTLILVDDEEMRSINKESRGIDSPTDILSFPAHAAVEAGVLEEIKFDIPDYYMLGDMIVDVPYVIRRCKEDQADLEEDSESDDEEEEEERGVSGAMATEFDPEARINMLLVHGLLHLVGHDHEEDDEYEVMVTKEEEILRELDMVEAK